MRYAGFVGPWGVSRSRIASADELVNLYVEKNEPTGKAPYVAYSCPGFELFSDLTGFGSVGPVRGQITVNGVTYAVVSVSGGGFAYSIDSSGTATIIGGIADGGDGLVSIAVNMAGDQMLIAGNGTLAYVDLDAHTSAPVPDIEADYVVYLDGTFFALNTTTSQLFASAPGDGSTWDPADVLEREDLADRWAGMLLYRGELYLPGSQTGSVYYDSAGEVFPLSPNPSGKLPFGTVSGRTAQICNGAPMWLAQDASGARIVVKVDGGYSPRRVSTHAIEFALGQLETVSDADAIAYQDQGHWFYVLSFPTEGVSFCYDDTTGLWHRRSPGRSLDLDDLDVFPGRTYAYAYGHHLVGDRTTGKIWRMSTDLYTNTDGSGLLRLRRAPHLADEQAMIRYNSLTLDMETGVGTVDAPDPQMTLRWSDDGGQTFGSEHERAIGAAGDYGVVVDWTQLGAARDRVFEVSCAEPVAITLIDAYLDVKRGRS